MKDVKIAICAILKDEHQYLDEWIKHHLSIGIDYIYLYEDNNSKPHNEICDKYDNVFLMLMRDFIDISKLWRKKQVHVYNNFIEKYKHEIDYVFFIDIDEFVMFEEGYDMSSLINICNERGSVLLPWKFYGANGLIDNPHMNIVDTYIKECEMELPKHRHEMYIQSKTFAKIDEGCMENMHRYKHSELIIPYDSGDIYHICWINHYITKSWEEWCYRIFISGQITDLVRTLNEFFLYNPDMLPLKDELLKKPYCLDKPFINF